MQVAQLLGLGLASLSLAGGASAQTVYFSFLDGAQASTTSTASGVGLFVIDTAANSLQYTITLSSFSSPVSVSHLHGPAAPGANAVSLVTLNAGSPIIGTWNYPQSVEQDILDGLTYVNVHTQAFPGGEIRGQILAPPDAGICTCDFPGSSCGSLDEAGGCPNSNGYGASIRWLNGMPSTGLDSLTLLVDDLPVNQPGLLFMGTSASNAVPFGNGLLCVSGFLARYEVRQSGPLGVVIAGPGLVSYSQAHFPLAGQIQAGDTRLFQFWYRDPGGPCGAGTNLTNAIEVLFTP